MEAIKKQASKLRDQVAKQQQTILKQLSGRFGHDFVGADEDELQCHQKLQMLYSSTKAAKHFQQDVARGVEAFISISSKQIEIVKRLADDCCKYGNEYQTSGFPLAKAAFEFGTFHNLMKMEKETLLKVFGDQIFDPLRAMIIGAPLEDARHLTHRYERIRQGVEGQRAEVFKRQLKSKEVGASADSAAKLQNAESKLSELKTTLSALGKEATSAMTSVEVQQQEITFQKLLEMVEAERSYHQKVAGMLEKLHEEMVSMKQHTDSHAHATTTVTNSHSQSFHEESHQTHNLPTNGKDFMYFVAEVVHPFEAQADGELSLSVGDYVVVHQVAPDGWSEGECKGKAGWFPSAYVHQCDKAPASKLLEASMLS